MAIIQWDSKYSVQNAKIDEQHRKLITLINELFEAMKIGKGNEALGSIFQGIVSYTKTHFAYEEQLMQKFNYPELRSHKQEHQKLISETEALLLKFNQNQAGIATKVGNFLKSWIVNHIQQVDKKYSGYLAAK